MQRCSFCVKYETGAWIGSMNVKLSRNDSIVDIEEIATKIVDAAMKVHTVLGPGLLGSAYQKCMEYELMK